MTEIGVETLKDELGDILARVRNGERVVSTDKGRSVAALVSLESNDDVSRAWKLVESGGASWRGGKPSGLQDRPKVRGSRGSDIVLEDRR